MIGGEGLAHRRDEALRHRWVEGTGRRTINQGLQIRCACADGGKADGSRITTQPVNGLRERGDRAGLRGAGHLVHEGANAITLRREGRGEPLARFFQ